MNKDIKIGDICYDAAYTDEYFFEIVLLNPNIIIKPIFNMESGRHYNNGTPYYINKDVNFKPIKVSCNLKQLFKLCSNS